MEASSFSPEVKAVAATSSIGVGGGGIGVLVVWLCGYLGLSISAEVGAVIGGACLGAGAAIGTYGLVGCLRIFLFGRNRSGRNARR